MAIDFEIIDSNRLDFDLSASQSLEFGTRDIIEVRQSGDYPDLTNKPRINDVILVGNKTTEELGIDVGVTSWNGQTGDVVYTPPEVPVQSVNGKTGNVVLNASDVGALSASTAIPSKTSDLQNDSGYITGITSSDVTSALGYTPYNATNPNGYVNATQAANAAPVQSVNGQTGAVSLSATDVNALPSNTPIHNVPSGGTSGQVLTKSSNSDYALEWSTPSGSVSSVNGQTGAVVLDAEDVGALPDDTVIPSKTSDLTNDSGFITGITSGDVTSALGYTPYDSSNPSGYITGINSGDVTTALGFTPYDASNPSGYVDSVGAASAAPVQSVNSQTGAVSLGAADVSALPDSTTYATSPTVGGSATFANGIHYAAVDSASTSTAFTAQIPGITEYYDGLTVMLYNGKVTSATNFTININGLGAYGSYNNMTLGNQVTPTNPTRDTTIFNINYSMLFTYCSHIGGSNTAGWIGYRGYDANTNTLGYQIRTNSTVRKVTDRTRYYRMLFSSADDTKWIPANTQYDNSATSVKTVNQRPINPFGEIVYLGNSTSYTADANMTATAIWQQYTFALGYSFNNTGAALTLTAQKPVYVKCAPQADGSAIIDSTEPIVQDLPTTADGKIYIWLGTAYSATNIELTIRHPVYYYNNGAIRLWTNLPIYNGGVI